LEQLYLRNSYDNLFLHTTLYSTPDTDIDSHRPTTGYENSHTY